MAARPDMPCEFHAFDGHSTREEREVAWHNRVLLLAAFPGAVLVDDHDQPLEDAA